MFLNMALSSNAGFQDWVSLFCVLRRGNHDFFGAVE